ncbi:MAG: inositol monophosphatase family protein [Puniceicoccaceae bacterium]
MPDPALEARIAAGRRAVADQVDLFVASFGAVESEWKADSSRVTEVDRAISERVLGFLGQAFPGDVLCSEESAPETAPIPVDSRFAWVLDPVDGTNNYAMGLPDCAISLALLREGFPVYGWVYDFAGKRLIHGGAARGVFAGDGPLRCHRPAESGSGPIGLQFPIRDKRLARLLPLLEDHRIRSLGSGTMEGVYVATGALSGAVDFRVKVWDIAAFIAFFEETKTPYEFLDQSPFPLRSFHPHVGPTPYLAGTQAFCRMVKGLLG